MTRTVYAIRDVYGEVIAEHVCVRFPDGKKRLWWQIPGLSPEDGLCGLSTPDLPLYGSEHVGRWATGQTVVVTEGEKARDALWTAGIDALGTVTGAGATPGEDALSILLPFDVVLWPDFDPAGERHMERVAAVLVRLGASVRMVGRGYDRGDDAADLITRVPVTRIINQARPWLVRQQPAPKPVRAAYADWERQDRVQSARSHLAQVAIEKLGHPKKQDRRSMWWACPFHQDRTPSFKVDLTEPYYVCFGCGARGDVFTFLRAIEGVEFKDALSELAPAPAIRTVTVWSL